MLDQSGEEFYPIVEILIALEDAQIEKAREYYRSGRREYIQSLYVGESMTNGGLTTRGDVSHVLTYDPMFFEACFVRLYPDESSARRYAIYMDPARYAEYQFSNQGVDGIRTGKLQYTFVGNVLRHNGADDGAGVYAARAVYYREPTIPSISTAFLLPDYTHGDIVDRAAKMLNEKNPINDHEAAGVTSDIIQRRQ